MKGSKGLKRLAQGAMVTAAVTLVLAVTLALSLPPDTALAAVLLAFDPQSLDQLQGWVLGWGGSGRLLWRFAVVPLLWRPVWFLPAAMGLIAAGVALTLEGRLRGQRRSRWPL